MDGDRLKIMLITLLVLAAAVGLLFLKRCIGLLRASLRLTLLVGLVAGLVALAWWFYQPPNREAPRMPPFYHAQQTPSLQR